MNTPDFSQKMQNMYIEIRDSPKLAGTFFSVINYLALSMYDGKLEIPKQELAERFSYRKNELERILEKGKMIGLFEEGHSGYRITETQTKAVSNVLKNLFYLIRTNPANVLTRLNPTDPLYILYKCREALYTNQIVSS